MDIAIIFGLLLLYAVASSRLCREGSRRIATVVQAIAGHRNWAASQHRMRGHVSGVALEIT
jgi:hypothetical protein